MPYLATCAMYLEQVSSFTNFLAEKDHTLNEILNHLSRVIFMNLEPVSIQFAQLNQSNLVVITAETGITTADSLQSPQTVNFEDNYPATDAIRYGKVVLINTLPDWGADYPLAKNLPMSSNAKTIITFPIYLSSTPVAVITVISRLVLFSTVDLELFLKAIGSIFSMYFYRNVKSSLDNIAELMPKDILESADSSEKTNELTERQLEILRLISEGQTNLSISQYLKYSESTVRQEVMRIFVKLGCSDRNEASLIYKSYTKKSLL